VFRARDGGGHMTEFTKQALPFGARCAAEQKVGVNKGLKPCCLVFRKA
jgi:hypothetical protein